jgi:hypothetical protein
MKRTALLIILIVGIGTLPAAADWRLEENSPNPFCNIPGEPNYSPTTISFELDVLGFVQLYVLSEDSNTVERTLVSGLMSAGFYEIVWVGDDSSGEPLGAGDYPYILEVFDEAGGDLLFNTSHHANVYCAVSSEEETWSLVKPRFSY